MNITNTDKQTKYATRKEELRLKYLGKQVVVIKGDHAGEIGTVLEVLNTMELLVNLESPVRILIGNIKLCG